MRVALLATVALGVLAPAALAAPPPAPVPLDEGWTVSVAGGAQRTVSVPHVVEGRATARSFGGTTAVYRLAFTGPQAPEGFGWALRFEAVRRKATVLLNGRRIGASRDGYVPFELLARGLRPGARNELEVRVDGRKGREPREGWWNWNGITRPVTLVPRGPVVLRHAALLPELRCDEDGRCQDARFVLDGWVTNRTGAPLRPRFAVELEAQESGARGQEVVDGPALAPGETRRVRAPVSIPGAPEVWSPATPRRYRATVETRLGGGDGPAVQRLALRPGLRSVAVRDGRLTLNGRIVDLRGASIQEDVPGRGPALRDADLDAIVRDLQAVGANVTRAHYLLHPGLLERLDAAGILVWSQAPVYHRDVLLRSPGGREQALASVRGTVLAARRHPSVLTHSVANELSAVPDTLPGTRDFLLRSAALTRELDPTLPPSLDVLSYPNLPREDRAYDAFDLLGVNSYFGWYPGKKGSRSTSDLADLGPFLRELRARHPRQALVMTEFGAEATKDGPSARKQTYGFQAEYLRRTMDVVEQTGFVDGAIYWTLREFAVKPAWDGLLNGNPRPSIAVDGIHNKGLVAYDGAPKPAWEEARRLFTAAPLFRGDAPPPSAEPASAGPSGGGLLAGGLLAGLVLVALWCLWAARSLLRAPRPADPARPRADVLPLRPPPLRGRGRRAAAG